MANTLISVPIEPLEGRYSVQWDRWFNKRLRVLRKTKGLEHRVIYGKALTDCIQNGCFLDVIGTNAYKASQLFEICKLIKDGTITSGDVFLFHDAWFPGIEMLAYIRDAMGINFKLCGMLHAGSYDPHDFLHRVGMQHWGSRLEECWLRIYDKIFVGSKFHKLLLMKERLTEGDCVGLKAKVEVTNWPIVIQDLHPVPVENDKLLVRAGLQWKHRKPLIIFPHRTDPEKRLWEWGLMREQFLKGLHPDDEEEWHYKTTHTQCHNKESYYNSLADARIAVSFADQETFGIAMQEATLLGCIPLVPDRLAYKEMYPSILRCTDWRETRDKALAMVLDSCFLKECRRARDCTAATFKRNGDAAISHIVKKAMSTASEYGLRKTSDAED